MVEVDFLPASHEMKSGDCILMRVGNFNYNGERNRQTVIMIDSGYSDGVGEIKSYLGKYYGTSRIDYVFITHPDQDHISGLNALLDDSSIYIGKIIIHDPWNHVNKVFQKTEDGRRTRKSIEGKFEETLKTLDGVFDKMEKRGIPTQEAFAGNVLDLGGYELRILGPSLEYYENKLMQFPGMESETSTGGLSIYKDDEIDWLWVEEFFLRKPETSAKNNSSMVILLSEKKKIAETTIRKPLFLFTGDAGTEALWRALAFADHQHIPVTGCSYVQLPHHGSLKNVDEHFLRYTNARNYVVSASSSRDDEHPSRLLCNFIADKLGKSLFHVADENGIRCSFGAPARVGWSTAVPKQMYEKVLEIKEGL